MSNQTILVTGAANGIGRAASKAIAVTGATVILIDKDIKGLESIYDEIDALELAQPAIYPIDLAGANGEDFEQLAMTIGDNFTALDGLLHCAATLGIMSRIDDYDAESWFKVLQTNLNAPFLLTQALLPMLRKSEHASILFCSDHIGRHPKAYWGAYAVAKAGIEGLMGVLADELENSNVRVNSFDPGPTRTALRLQAFPGETASKLQSPEDVALTVSELLTGKQDTHGKQLAMRDFNKH